MYSQNTMELTNLPLDKMATILADDIFKCILLNGVINSDSNFTETPGSPIDNKQELVQVMAWRRAGDKPLPESLLTQFTNGYMRHSGEMS